MRLRSFGKGEAPAGRARARPGAARVAAARRSPCQFCFGPCWLFEGGPNLPEPPACVLPCFRCCPAVGMPNPQPPPCPARPAPHPQASRSWRTAWRQSSWLMRRSWHGTWRTLSGSWKGWALQACARGGSGGWGREGTGSGAAPGAAPGAACCPSGGPGAPPCCLGARGAAAWQLRGSDFARRPHPPPASCRRAPVFRTPGGAGGAAGGARRGAGCGGLPGKGGAAVRGRQVGGSGGTPCTACSSTGA
jgi:hypothetical protein